MQLLSKSVCLCALIALPIAAAPAPAADISTGQVRVDQPSGEIAAVLIRSAERYQAIASESRERVWDAAQRTLSDMFALFRNGARPGAIAGRARLGAQHIDAIADRGANAVREQRSLTFKRLRELEAPERAFEADQAHARRAIDAIRSVQRSATGRIGDGLARLTG